MRILISGAAGMLGVDVVSAARERGHDVCACSRAELDISDGSVVSTVIERERPEVIINCAAYTNVDGAESDRENARLINAVGPGNLGAAAAKVGAWCIHVSTDYVFDGSASEPYVESDKTNPTSVYGATKLAGELALASAAPEAHTIARTAWLFGTHGRCFPATMLRLASERGAVKVVSDQIGCPTFTEHLADALLELAETDRGQRPVGVLHLAAAGQCSWYEFAAATIAGAGIEATVSPCTTADFPTPATRPAFSVLRSERGAPVLPDWRDGLTAYLATREQHDRNQASANSANEGVNK